MMFFRKHEHKFHSGPVSHLSRIAAFAAAALIVFPLCGETIGSWPGEGDAALIPNASPRKIVKILSRKPEFSVQLTGDADKKTDLQIEFSKPYRLVAGTRCRISVEMKADQEIELNMGILGAKPPYKSLPKSWKICRLKPEYRVFSHEFVIEKDYDQPFYTPLFVSKDWKSGTQITVRNVTFETVEGSIIPLPAVQNWTLFAKPGIKPEELQKITSIPEKLGSSEAKKLMMGKDVVSIPEIPNEKDIAVLMTEIESPADGKMQAGFSADWWAEIYVNGYRCESTMVTGNMSHKFVPDDHVFNFNVKKGKNLIAVYLKSGMKGGKFIFGAVKYRHKLSRITEVVEGREWRPTKMDDVEWNSGKVPPPPGVSPQQWRKEFLVAKKIKKFNIISGSALDMSQYVPHYDIDKLGFLIADKDGHVVSSADPSVRVKLRGFNFYMTHLYHRFYCMSHKDLEEYAEAIYRSGMNIVRLQMLNRFLLGFGGYPVPRAKQKKASQVKYPQTPEELEIDKAALDRYDYFTKCLRDRGIYIMADILNTAFGWSKALIKDTNEDNISYQLLADSPGKRAHFAAAFKFMMNHVNPYTGKKFKDDPQFMCITYINEIEHVFSDRSIPLFNKVFQAWCKEKNIEVKKPFGRALLLDKTPEGDAARKFILERIDDSNEFLLKLTKQEGYRGFVTLYDMNVRHLCGWGRRNFNSVAMHTYHAHPAHYMKLNPANFKQKLRFGGWWRNKMSGINQSSSIREESNYIGAAAVSRVLGKPFFLTEYAHSNYNQYVQEGGISMGAYAALQDWDIITPHANCIALYYSPMFAGFESPNSMTQRAGRMLTAFAWQRGDVSPAKKSININIPEKITRSGDILGSIGFGHNALFMLSKIGSSYDSVKRGNFQFFPTKFTGVSYQGMYVVQEADSRDQNDQLENSVKELKKSGFLPSGNRTDVQKGLFESDTGEILADTKKHTLRVVTSRLESLVLKPGQQLKGNLLSVNSASIPVTVSAVSIDGSKPLSEAKRLLLFVQTMSVSKNAVFSTENFDFEIDHGGLKTMERAGQFDIALKTDLKHAPKFYALNPDGSREKELPVSFDQGKLTIHLDTSKLEYGTPFFELVY